ncbi:unnamed protein product [Rhodiola kirilowii]
MMSVSTPFAYIAVQMALKAAIELNVFDILAESGPPGTQLSASQIASKIPTTNPNQAVPALHRILRFLSSNSFLTTSLPLDSTIDDERDRLFGLTGLTASTLVRSDGADSLPMIGSVLLLHSQKEMFECLDKLKYTVLDPERAKCPFEMAHGVEWYDYLAQRPCSQLNMLFDRVMSGSYNFFCDSLMRVYRGFDDVIELIDVGGNDGSALEYIISFHPQIKSCINFDLPGVIARAPYREGVKHVAGDMFVALPSCKTIMLKWILHNWSDQECEKLLQNCWTALPEGGKVISVEMMIPDNLERSSETVMAITFDFIMLAFFTGGKERTLSEFRKLATAAGFSDVVNVVPIENGMHVLEFLK